MIKLVLKSNLYQSFFFNLHEAVWEREEPALFTEHRSLASATIWNGRRNTSRHSLCGLNSFSGGQNSSSSWSKSQVLFCIRLGQRNAEFRLHPLRYHWAVIMLQRRTCLLYNLFIIPDHLATTSLCSLCICSLSCAAVSHVLLLGKQDKKGFAWWEERAAGALVAWSELGQLLFCSNLWLIGNLSLGSTENSCTSSIIYQPGGAIHSPRDGLCPCLMSYFISASVLRMPRS